MVERKATSAMSNREEEKVFGLAVADVTAEGNENEESSSDGDDGSDAPVTGMVATTTTVLAGGHSDGGMRAVGADTVL